MNDKTKKEFDALQKVYNAIDEINSDLDSVKRKIGDVSFESNTGLTFVHETMKMVEKSPLLHGVNDLDDAWDAFRVRERYDKLIELLNYLEITIANIRDNTDIIQDQYKVHSILKGTR